MFTHASRMAGRSRAGLAVASLVTWCILVAGWATPSGAQSISPQTYYRWLAPAVEQQLAADTTPIPAGSGSLFVPALSDGESEPQAVVLQGERQVTTGPNGTRLAVSPGEYTVLVGSGPTPQMARVSVRVTEGQTAIVPIRWGGLRIEVVDENNIPHRGSFELIRVENRQPYVVGFGADTLQGERIATLLVPEGLYRIVRRGSNYRARTDFSTVLVPEGALVHYKLVLDPSNGGLRGAGVVPPEEIGIVTDESPWDRRYSIGLSLPYASTRNVVGAPNQTSVATDLFFDTYLTYQSGQNFLSSILEIEQGILKLNPEGTNAVPLQKTRDRVRADLFASRFVRPNFGPYVRFGLLTNARASTALFTAPAEISVNRLDGTQDTRQVSANDTIRTGGAFSPLLIRQGAGINARVVRSRSVTLDWRGGVGMRQNRFNRALFLNDDPTTAALEYREVESFNEVGAEMTVVATARYRFLLVNTNFDLFGNAGGDEFNATVDWRNTISWRLTRDLSLDFNIDLLRLPQVRSENQLTQTVLLRYSFGS